MGSPKGSSSWVRLSSHPEDSLRTVDPQYVPKNTRW